MPSSTYANEPGGATSTPSAVCAVPAPRAMPVARIAATALFWAWCLIWVSNAANASWPVRSPEAFWPVRIMWITGMALFALVAMHPVLQTHIQKRTLLVISAPVTLLATLIVVIVDPVTSLDLAVLAVAGLAAGWGAGGLLPVWSPAFSPRDPARLSLLITISALGAAALFHGITVLPGPWAEGFFVALPLLAGVCALLERSADPGSPSAIVPAPSSGSTSNIFVTVDAGYALFAVLAGFTMGLDVLSYDAPSRDLVVVLPVVATAAVSVFIALALLWNARSASEVSGYHAVLPLVVVGAITLPYAIATGETLVQLSVASVYMCWVMIFTLTQFGRSHDLMLFGRTYRFNVRTVGALGAIVAMVASYWLSRTYDLAGGHGATIIVAMTYTLVVVATLLVSSRVAIYNRAQHDQPPLPACDACEQMAAHYRLTPREKEILHILAAGRSQTYVQQTLVIAQGTATTHINHIYQKLAIHSRDELLDLVEDWRTRSDGDA